MPADSRTADQLEAELRARFLVVEQSVTLANRTYRVLRPRSADDLLDEAAFNCDGRIPYWAEVWLSGRVLGELLAREARPGTRLLELGCGIGTATYPALAAGWNVTATDYYPEALEFLELNVLANGLPMPALRMIDWRNLPEDLGKFDLVVAADVLYETPHAALVAGVIAGTLAPAGEALLVDPQRPGAATFIAECLRRGLGVHREGVDAVNDQGQPQTLHLYRIRHHVNAHSQP